MIIILVIAGLSILILGHEFGHFLAAKLFGLKVEEFGFGLPPRAVGALRYSKIVKLTDKSFKKIKKWVIFRKNRPPKYVDGFKADDTVYSLNCLPFGGFVKIAGERERIEDAASNNGGTVKAAKEEKKRLFSSQPPWKKILILSSGVAANFIIGWIFVSMVFVIGIQKSLIVTGIQPNSPAERSGMAVGDIIKDFKTYDKFSSFIKSHIGENVEFSVMRGGKEIKINVFARNSINNGKEGAIGVYLSEAGIKKVGILTAVWEGLKTSLRIARMVVVSFYKIVQVLIFKGSLAKGVVGPVGIFFMAEQSGKMGIVYLLQIIGIISINLVIVNLVPFPALDGGRILMIAVEKIKGSPISAKVEALANGIGFLLLIIFILLVTFRDIKIWV